MALSKLIETSYGVSANYHKITETKIDWHNRIANITVKSFLSSEARTAGKMPIIDHAYYWAGDDFVFAPDSNVIATAYAKLKTMEQWTNAIDV